MTQSLLSSVGIYGGSFIVAFIAGLFPLISIEVFLMGLSAVMQPTLPAVLGCCVLAATGHQIAKTITYYTGVGALEHGKLKEKIEQIRPRIDKWNKAPHLVLVLAGAIGLPPLWIIGFIARPLMGLRFIPFTLIVYGTRIGRFIVLAGIPLLF